MEAGADLTIYDLKSILPFMWACAKVLSEELCNNKNSSDHFTLEPWMCNVENNSLH